MDSGENLYKMFADGDDNAFCEIIKMYKDSLIFFIYRYVGNYTVAEDIAQDVFVEIILHKNRYNRKTSFKTYLFTIGRNKAIDYLRRISRHPEIPDDYTDEKSDFSLLEDEFAAEERKKALHNSLNELPEDYRTVLHMIYFEDMSYEEAGRVMKKNKKQITNLVYRAKKALKEKLGKESVFVEDR